jgi:MraZ protein
MLLGSFPARIDEKFRLKIPARFRRDWLESEENAFYVTSYDGRRAQIYPLAVWSRIAEKFKEAPRMDSAKEKLENFTSFYGLLTQMDSQGRILIPQALREDAQIVGEVTVIGKTDHLEVWNTDTFRRNLKERPLTDADRERLAEQGF